MLILLKSNLDINKPQQEADASSLNKSQSLAAALGVAKFKRIISLKLVTHCCPAIV